MIILFEANVEGVLRGTMTSFDIIMILLRFFSFSLYRLQKEIWTILYDNNEL